MDTGGVGYWGKFDYVLADEEISASETYEYNVESVTKTRAEISSYYCYIIKNAQPKYPVIIIPDDL